MNDSTGLPRVAEWRIWHPGIGYVVFRLPSHLVEKGAWVEREGLNGIVKWDQQGRG